VAYDVNDFIEAMHDGRVARSLDLALRDAAIRRMVRERRREGETVEVAVLAVAERFSLSEERVRAIVYRK
jgi:hypothetical protein